jgi:phage repressor protein C with HTH and peptisase S24 domain
MVRNYVSNLIQLMPPIKIDSAVSKDGGWTNMLTHSQVWVAIDSLAAREGLTPSSLAKKAGLDPTTFNRSKRQNSAGQLRWPSTESIAKILAATGVGVDDFLRFLVPTPVCASRIPFRTLTGIADSWFDAHGRVNPAGWDEIAFPAESERILYALEIRGDRFNPVYREGDTIIVAPEAEPRRGDRVFIVDREGVPSIEVLDRQTATHIHVSALAGGALPPRTLGQVMVLARIVWASQ